MDKFKTHNIAYTLLKTNSQKINCTTFQKLLKLFKVIEPTITWIKKYFKLLKLPILTENTASTLLQNNTNNIARLAVYIENKLESVKKH